MCKRKDQKVSADNNQIWNFNWSVTNKWLMTKLRDIYEPERKKIQLALVTTTAHNEKHIKIQTHTWKIMVMVSYFPYLCESILGPCPRDITEWAALHWLHQSTAGVQLKGIPHWLSIMQAWMFIVILCDCNNWNLIITLS